MPIPEVAATPRIVPPDRPPSPPFPHARTLVDHVAPDVQLYNETTWNAAADRTAEWATERTRRAAAETT